MTPDDKVAQVPYFVHEGMIERQDRTIRRLIIALILCILLIFASNALWLWSWMQYDYTGEETQVQKVDVDAKDGTANYIGNNGSITNGTNTSNDNDKAQAGTETERDTWYEG